MDINNWYIVITEENRDVCMSFFKNHGLTHQCYSIGAGYGRKSSFKGKYIAKSEETVMDMWREDDEISFENFKKYILGINIIQFENYEIY